MQIIVNGRLKTVTPEHEKFTYEEIAALAGRDPAHNPTITYHDGNRSGMLSHGESVTVENGMVFNCFVTGGA
jgi:hypothetical protein